MYVKYPMECLAHSDPPLAIRQHQGYLMDVALIYALIGFLAVVVLCKVFMGITLEQREKKQKEADKNA